jgi:hypothetical protein
LIRHSITSMTSSPIKPLSFIPNPGVLAVIRILQHAPNRGPLPKQFLCLEFFYLDYLIATPTLTMRFFPNAVIPVRPTLQILLKIGDYLHPTSTSSTSTTFTLLHCFHCSVIFQPTTWFYLGFLLIFWLPTLASKLSSCMDWLPIDESQMAETLPQSTQQIMLN